MPTKSSAWDGRTWSPHRNLIGVDWETYWGVGYTLTSMATSEYVRDPRFKIHGVGIRLPGEDTKWYSDLAEIENVLEGIDWSVHGMVAHNCVTGDHEALTPHGWKRLDELDGTEQIAQWNPESGIASFTDFQPVVHHYVGKLLEYNTSCHCGVYTPDHRMYFTTPQVPEWRARTASQVAKLGPNNVYIPIAANQLEVTDPFHVTPDQARFIEAVRADGSYNGITIRFRFKKERKILRLRSLLAQLQVPFHESKDADITNFIAKDCESVRLAKEMLGITKSYSESVLRLAPDAQRAILEELQFWDGSVNPRQTVFATADYDSAYWIQILSALNGFRVKFTKTVNQRGFNANNPNAVLYTTTIRKKARVKLLKKPREIDYDGNVYCVQVPTKAFFIRRNDTVWITGNCYFDGFILHEHFNIHPAVYVCTRSMSRANFGVDIGHRLDDLAQRVGVGRKIEGTLESTKNLEQLTPEHLAELGVYCIQDVDLMMDALDKLIEDGFPEQEMDMIDMSIRMFCDPKLEVDEALAREEIKSERTEKKRLLDAIEPFMQDIRAEIDAKYDLTSPLEDLKWLVLRDASTKDILMSNDQLAILLEYLGIDIPMKVSPATGEMTFAFAKADEAFVELLEDPVAGPFIAARLAVKSTIKETRAERLINHGCPGPLPIMLVHWGAHTGRASGGDKMNPQNFSSGRDGSQTRLRNAIMAPKGKVIVAVDSRQGEARVGAALAGQQDLLDSLIAGIDIYTHAASKIYKVSPEEVTKIQRFFGKTAQLGLQFRVGYKKFHRTVHMQAKAFGLEIDLTEAGAKKIVDAWREANDQYVITWKFFDNMLPFMYSADEGESRWLGPLEVQRGRIWLPSNLCMWYDHLYPYEGPYGTAWKVLRRKTWRNIHGGCLYENVTQAVHRQATFEQALLIKKRYPEIVLMVHDEIVFLAPVEEAEEALAYGLKCMSTPPAWMPNLPLEGEGAYGERYAH